MATEAQRAAVLHYCSRAVVEARRSAIAAHLPAWVDDLYECGSLGCPVYWGMTQELNGKVSSAHPSVVFVPGPDVWKLTCDEYASPITYCPWCGVELSRYSPPHRPAPDEREVKDGQD